MQTAIGQSLKSSPRALTAACGVAAFVVAADLALALWRHESTEGLGTLAVVALSAHLWIVQGDLPCVGLRVRPAPSWKYWIGVTLLIGLAVGAAIVIGLGAWTLLGHELPIYTTAPAGIGTTFLRMCIYAPILEEFVYRLALCVPLAAAFGAWPAIAVSGLAFAGVHLARGIPSPENLVGGFFLAWAFLKSESIALPMLLHGLGNLCVLAGQVAAWHWLRSGG